MQDITIIPVQDSGIEDLCALASRIWKEHYGTIIGPQQIDFMLDKFQSPRAVREQIRQGGYSYYFLELDGGRGGYFGVQPEEDGLFLSKLYVAREYRHKGLAKTAVDFLCKECARLGKPQIRLTVNKNNIGSIKAYQRMGFEIADSTVSDIGGGFVMDDYIMVRKTAR